MTERTPDPIQLTANNALLDAVATAMGARTDAALAMVLDVAPAIISKIRHGRQVIGARMQLTMLEDCDLTLAQIRQYVPRMRTAREAR